MNWTAVEAILVLLSMVINLVLVVGGAFATLFLKGLNSTLGEMKVRNNSLEISVREIEILVRGKHVTREEMDQRLDRMNVAIFAKLDKIEDKLDGKADREEHVLK